MLSRSSDKKINKKAVTASTTPSVGNVSLIGKSTIDISKVEMNGQPVTLNTSSMQAIQSTPGTATAGKALVVDSSKNIDNLQDITSSELYVNGEQVTGLLNTGATVSDSMYMNNIQPGTAAAGKIMSLDEDKNTSASLVTANNVLMNGGTVSTSGKYRMQSLDTVYKFISLYDTPSLYIVGNFSTYAGNGTAPKHVVKIGKIYMIVGLQYTTPGNNFNHAVNLFQDVYSSGGGAWNLSFSTITVTRPSDCWYDQTTDRHYIPYGTFTGNSTYTLSVYVSPTGDPATWTAGQWTSYNICSCSATMTDMNTSNFPSTVVSNSIRWSSLLNKFVCMGFFDNTSNSKLSHSSLYTSTDGTSWTKTSTLPVTGTVVKFAVTSSAIFAFTNTTTMYYTTNGTTWTSKTLLSQPLPNATTGCDYYPEIDLIVCGTSKRIASTLVALAAGSNLHQNEVPYTVGENYLYDSTLQIYYNNDSSSCRISSPTIFYNIQFPGQFIGGYILFFAYTTSVFASNVSLRYSIDLQQDTTETVAIVDPSEFLKFENKTKSIVYDFVWVQSINKYIVLATVYDGFNSGYSSSVGIFYSNDLETFTYVSTLPSTTVNAMCYSERLDALHVYTMNSSSAVYTSLDKGLTFSSTTPASPVRQIYYEPLIRSAMFMTGTVILINTKNPLSWNSSANGIMLDFGNNGNMSYIPATTAIIGNRSGSGNYVSTNLLSAIATNISSTLYARTSYFYGTFTINTTTNSTYVENPRYGQIISLNDYKYAALNLESFTGRVVSGTIVSNIEYIDHAKIYVAMQYNTSYSTSSRFVYSYDMIKWIEPVINGLSANTPSLSAYVVKYDKRSGYLYILGSNGFFKTIQSLKSFVPTNLKNMITNYNGPIAQGTYSGNIWPFTKVSSLSVNDITYCRGVYVACTSNAFMYGPSVMNISSVAATGNWVSIAASKNTFVAVASDKIAYSTNGSSWTNVSVSGLQKINWSAADSKFGAVGTNVIAFSSDGITWSTFAVTGNWKSIKYDNGYWLAVGLNKIAYTTSSTVAPTVLTVTGDWYDSAFGGQWILVGANACAFTNKINDITSWVTITMSGSYSNVEYVENLRCFFLTGESYSVYYQTTNTFKHYTYSLTSLNSKWFYRLQCFIMPTAQGLYASRVLDNGVESSLCMPETNNLVTRTTGVESNLNITDGTAILSTNQPVSISCSVSGSGILSLSNNSEESVTRIVNYADYLTWEAPKAFNFTAKYIKFGSSLLQPIYLPNPSDVSSLSVSTMGTVSGDSYLSVDYSGNMAANAVTAGGLIVNGTLYSPTTPSYLTGVTQGTASASKGLLLNVNKEVTGVNRLTLESLSLGYNSISTNSADTSIAMVSHGQASTDGSTDLILNCAYNEQLGLYAAALNQTSFTNSTNPERLYIIVSKDAVSWHKSYIGVKGYCLKIISITPSSPLASSFNLGGKYSGFVIFLASNSHTSKCMFTPDCVNYYNVNMTGSAYALDTYISTSTLIFTTDYSSVPGTGGVAINNSTAHPNRILTPNTTGLNATWASSTSENNYIYAFLTTATTLWGVTSANNIVTHTVGASTSTSLATGETCNAACHGWNYGGNSLMRIVVTSSGKVLYGGNTTTSTSYTVDSSYNFRCCAYNPVLRKFIIGTSSGRLYISAADSVTSWTVVSTPSEFGTVSWKDCAPADVNGFVVWHESTGNTRTLKKICRVSADGIFYEGVTSLEFIPGAGCYGMGYFVLPSTISGSVTNKIMYSADGLHWDYTLNTSQWLREVIYTGSKFVAITYSNILYTSTDLVNWTTITNTLNSLNYISIIYAADKGMAVIISSGTNGCITYSTDMINWTNVALPYIGNNVSYLAYSQTIGRFAFSCSYTPGVPVVTSADLVTFTKGQSTDTKMGNIYPAGIVKSISGALYLFSPNPSRYWKSVDGINWTIFEGFMDFKTNQTTQLTFTSSVERTFVDVPGLGTVMPYANDPDGTCLISVNNDSYKLLCVVPGGTKDEQIYRLVYNPDANTILMYKNMQGTRPGEIFQLIDLNEYKDKTTKDIPVDYIDKLYPNTPTLNTSMSSVKTISSTLDAGAAYINSNLAAQGTLNALSSYITTNGAYAWSPSLNMLITGSSTYRYSYDGVNWTNGTTTPSSNALNGLLWSTRLGLFVAVGNTFIQTSPDGINWTTRYSNAINSWNSVAENNNILVAVGSASSTNKVFTSTDGITWTARNSVDDSLATNYIGVKWASSLGLFVAVSSNSATYRSMYSSDGITWSSRKSMGNFEANTWVSFDWSASLGMFVAVASAGTNRISVSYNGKIWATLPITTYDVNATAVFSRVMYSVTQGQFIAGSSSGTVYHLVSSDGLSWYAPTSAITSGITNMADVPALNMVLLWANVISTTYYIYDSKRTFNEAKSLEYTFAGADIIYSENLEKYIALNRQTLLCPTKALISDDGYLWKPSNYFGFNGTRLCEGFSGSTLRIIALNISGNIDTTIHYTSNGIDWDIASLPSNITPTDICWGNNLFVMVGSSGTNRVMTSTNGLTWTAYTSAGETMTWRCVAYGNIGGTTNMYVALASAGTGNRLMTSTNGTSWTLRATPNDTLPWVDVEWSDPLGMFVAVSSSSGSPVTIITSTNGTSWTTAATAPYNNVSSNFARVKWCTDHFVVTTPNTYNTIMISYDGVRWYTKYLADNSEMSCSVVVNRNLIRGSLSNVAPTSYIKNYINAPTLTATTLSYYAMEYVGNNTIVALNSSTTTRVSRTTDGGNTWSLVAGTNDSTNLWSGLAYSSSLNRLVAVSSSGTLRIMYSNDKGLTWVGITAPSDTNLWKKVAYGNGVFAAISSNGTYRAMYSSDGISWTDVTVSTSVAWSDVTFGNGMFVAVGASSSVDNVMTSTDGINWTTQTSGDKTVSWWAVRWSSLINKFIATGGPTVGKIMTSPDGATWTVQTIPAVSTTLTAISTGANTIVVMGLDGSGNSVTLVSSNGTDWNTTIADPVGNPSSATYLPETDSSFFGHTSGNNRIVQYVKPNADPYVNYDSKMIGSTGFYFNKICWGNNEFMASGKQTLASKRGFARSVDGINWTYIPTSVAGISYGIAYGNSTYVSVCSTAPKIAYSFNGMDWLSTASADEAKSWNTIKFLGGMFVAIGTNCIAYSYDGISWTMANTTTANWNNIAYSDSLFMYIAIGDSNKLATSSDGISWTVTSGPASATWFGIDWSPTLQVFLMSSSTNSNGIWYSADGTNWTSCNKSLAVNSTAVVWDATNLVFIVSLATTGFLITKDLIYWSSKDYVPTRGTNDMAYSPTLGCVVTADSTVSATSNTYGLFVPSRKLNFSIYVPTIATDTFWDVIWSNSFGRFCAFKKSNTLTNDSQQYFSLDGYKWITDGNTYTSYDSTSRSSNIQGYTEIPHLDTIITCRGTAFIQIMSTLNVSQVAISGIGNCMGLTYVNTHKTLVIIGSTGLMLVALGSDLSISQFKVIALPTSATFDKIIICNEKYMLVRKDSSNTYYYSTNLTTWTSATLPESAVWKFTAEQGTKRVIAASSAGTIAYTDDAINWTTAFGDINAKFVNVKYFPDQKAFIACDYNGTYNILYSVDNGVSWPQINITPFLKISDIAYSPHLDTFVIVSEGQAGGNALSSITVTLPKIPSGGNVLRYNNGALGINTFNTTPSGGITTNSQYYSGFMSNNTENMPLIALATDGAYKPSSSSWTIFSDRRIKKDIQQLDDEQCLEIIKALPLKYYKWKDQFAEQTETTDMHKLGWIAQDVEKAVPTAIKSIGDYTLKDGTVISNLKTLNTDQLVVLMHGATRALIKRYKTLEQTLTQE